MGSIDREVDGCAHMSKSTQASVIQLDESSARTQSGISLEEILDVLYHAGRNPLGLQQTRQRIIGDPG